MLSYSMLIIAGVEKKKVPQNARLIGFLLYVCTMISSVLHKCKKAQRAIILTLIVNQLVPIIQNHQTSKQNLSMDQLFMCTLTFQAVCPSISYTSSKQIKVCQPSETCIKQMSLQGKIQPKDYTTLQNWRIQTITLQPNSYSYYNAQQSPFD